MRRDVTAVVINRVQERIQERSEIPTGSPGGMQTVQRAELDVEAPLERRVVLVVAVQPDQREKVS
jgi:hypothetical protein